MSPPAPRTGTPPPLDEVVATAIASALRRPYDRSAQPAAGAEVVPADRNATDGGGESEAAAPRIAVAYSGGADSSALLHVAAGLQARGVLDVVALHVHHGLAPAADAWLAHCREEAAHMGVRFDSERVHLPRERASLEAEARRLRYAALILLCRRHGASLLLTGHHADDQAETVLINLARGAGIGGLAGAARSRPLDAGLTLLRPLIDVPAERLRAHVAAHGLAHVEDPSNDDRRFTRNAIRHEVLPAWRRIVPTIATRLAQTAAHASTLQALLDEIGNEDLHDDAAHGRPPVDEAEGASETNTVIDTNDALDVERIEALTDARAANALRVWLARRGMRAPSTAALREMIDQLLNASPDAQIALLHEQQTLRLYRGRVSIDRGGPARAGPKRLTWHGEAAIEVCEWDGVLHFEPATGPGLDPAALRAGPLLLRDRRGGERLRMRADGPSRTLKNLYQEAGIAAWQRTRLPLVYLGDRLVHAAGLGTNATTLDTGIPADGSIALRWEAGARTAAADGS